MLLSRSRGAMCRIAGCACCEPTFVCDIRKARWLFLSLGISPLHSRWRRRSKEMRGGRLSWSLPPALLRGIGHQGNIHDFNHTALF
jgi:hypothetical protein